MEKPWEEAARLEKEAKAKKKPWEEAADEEASEVVEEETTLGEKAMTGLRVVGNTLDIPGSIVRSGVDAALDPEQEVLPAMGDQLGRIASEFPYGSETAPSGEQINERVTGERPDSMLKTIGGFTTEVALDPLSFVGYGAGKKLGKATAGEILPDGPTGLKAVAHDSASRSLAKNVTNSKYLNEGVDPDAMGARIVEEGLAPFLNNKAELYKQISGKSELSFKNPGSLDTLAIGEDRSPGLIGQVSEELKATLLDIEKRNPNEKFKVSTVAAIKKLKEMGKLIDPLSGETPEIAQIEEIVHKALKPTAKVPKPPRMPEPPPLPAIKPIKANNAQNMIPPVPLEAGVSAPIKENYLKVPSDLLNDFPTPPEKPFPDPNITNFRATPAVKKMYEEQEMAKYGKELVKYESQMMKYISDLTDYKKQVDSSQKAKLAQYQEDLKHFGSIKDADKATAADFKLKKQKQELRDLQKHQAELENFRFEVSNYKKDYAAWKKAEMSPNYFDTERELTLTQVHKLRQNIGKHLSDRAFYAAPDKAMAQEKEVLVDLYRILGTLIEGNLQNKKVTRNGEVLNALDVYKASNSRVKNLMDVQSALESENLKALQAPSFMDTLLGGFTGGVLGAGSGMMAGMDPTKSAAIGASFGAYRGGKDFAQKTVPGMMANGADKLGDFLNSKAGQVGSGLGGAAVQRGTINYFKEGRPMGREPQSVPNIAEEFIRTPLPRTTEELMQNKKFVLGKVAQMMPEMFEAVKDVYENNPENLAELAQVISMKMPHMFKKDKYNRFDGRILSEKDKQKAIKDTLGDSSISTIEQAKIITKLNKEGLYDRD